MRLEMRSKSVASLHADDEKMVHGLVAAIVVGTRDAWREHLAIPGGHLTPSLVPLVEAVGLHAQHRGLQVVEARRLADDSVLVVAHASMIAQQLQPGRQRGVVGRDQAAVAEGAEILRRVK